MGDCKLQKNRLVLPHLFSDISLECAIVFFISPGHAAPSKWHHVCLSIRDSIEANSLGKATKSTLQTLANWLHVRYFHLFHQYAWDLHG